ncbi:MAG: molybdopterin-dependent oxidoreductase [Gemmatimonadaceae bacterium]
MILRRLIAAGCLLSTLAAAQSTAPALKLVALDGASTVMRLAELQALPQVELTDSSPSTGVARFRGPTVRAVVSLAGAPEGRALRGPSMVIVVLAEASDGYKVAYRLAELDEQFGARAAIVALTQDGQPLPTSDGPLRIVVPGETHRARWIRQLTTLRLLRAGEGAREDSLTRP